MKNVLVIHPQDPSTSFLSTIYDGRGWNVITQTLPAEELQRAIEKHDRIVMLGHGTPDGLLNPRGGFLIDTEFGELLKYKTCVSIWCHAVYYTIAHRIGGLCTGMIVSEESESIVFNLPTEQNLIDESNEMFASAVRKHIFTTNPAEKIRKDYNSDTNPIIQYNRRNIFYR